MSLTELSKEQIKKIKEEYPSGTEIIVDRMADDPRPVAPGTQGTVIAVDDIGTLHCNFNGRQLGVIPGVDSFHKANDFFKVRVRQEEEGVVYIKAVSAKDAEKIVQKAWNDGEDFVLNRELSFTADSKVYSEKEVGEKRFCVEAKSDNISYSRLLQILQDYVNNDAEAAEEGYVRSILKDICGVNKEEAEQLGLGYLFDAEEEEEEEK